MIDFENRIIGMMRTESSGPDSASFIAKLHGRQEKEMMRKKRMRSGFSAFAFIFLVGMLTTSQFVELPKQDIYWSEVDNNIEYFDTDFLTFDEGYDTISVEEFTLFMIEETNIWDTEDLIYFNELYENTNVYEVSL
tara:strand:- start:201 stop:608 length:408 start_codon:yes stop_codon:yes gene_type:complete